MPFCPFWYDVRKTSSSISSIIIANLLSTKYFTVDSTSVEIMYSLSQRPSIERYFYSACGSSWTSLSPSEAICALSSFNATSQSDFGKSPVTFFLVVSNDLSWEMRIVTSGFCICKSTSGCELMELCISIPVGGYRRTLDGLCYVLMRTLLGCKTNIILRLFKSTYSCVGVKPRVLRLVLGEVWRNFIAVGASQSALRRMVGQPHAMEFCSCSRSTFLRCCSFIRKLLTLRMVNGPQLSC